MLLIGFSLVFRRQVVSVTLIRHDGQVPARLTEFDKVRGKTCMFRRKFLNCENSHDGLRFCWISAHVDKTLTAFHLFPNMMTSSELERSRTSSNNSRRQKNFPSENRKIEILWLPVHCTQLCCISAGVLPNWQYSLPGTLKGKAFGVLQALPACNCFFFIQYCRLELFLDPNFFAHVSFKKFGYPAGLFWSYPNHSTVRLFQLSCFMIRSFKCNEQSP